MAHSSNLNLINKIIKINQVNDGPLTYGVGLRIKSIVGPLNFVWGRGYSDPLNQKSKKQNILYFNFDICPIETLNALRP